MELGQRIRQTRLEAGLSQRQLCGEALTRNMLSQIENGSARPSMATLQLLAARLQKPVSYFLEEDAVTSPNQSVMAQSRDAFAAGNYSEAYKLLNGYRGPDPVFDQEMLLLSSLCRLSLAAQAIRDGKLPYAAALLEQLRQESGRCVYFGPELEKQRLLLLAGTRQESPIILAASLAADDRELLLRAEAALLDKDPARSIQLLDAAENRQTPDWNFLRGEACFALKEYAAAAACYAQAEEDHPKQVLSRLEICYRELGDYKKAYEYALKQR